jgi:hypothetical protein
MENGLPTPAYDDYIVISGELYDEFSDGVKICFFR